MIPEKRMPPKLANEIAPAAWVAKVEAWRRHQPDPMPNTSEAIRQLVEIGLKAESQNKPKPKK